MAFTNANFYLRYFRPFPGEQESRSDMYIGIQILFIDSSYTVRLSRGIYPKFEAYYSDTPKADRCKH